jgi:hypothetical protein
MLSVLAIIFLSLLCSILSLSDKENINNTTTSKRHVNKISKQNKNGPPKVVYSSLQIEYIRALKPYKSSSKKSGFEMASTSLVFAIYRVRFDRNMYVRRWNGTAMNDYPLPIRTPIGNENYILKHLSNDKENIGLKYHRHGLQSITNLHCKAENETFYSHEHPHANDILQSNNIPPEIFSLPSIGSDQLKFAEDIFYNNNGSEENNKDEYTDDGNNHFDDTNAWKQNEYVGAVLLYHERPSGPGGYSSETAEAKITNNVLSDVPSFEDGKWRAALEKRMLNCKLEFPRMVDQAFWPLGELVDKHGSPISNNLVNKWTIESSTNMANLHDENAASWLTVLELDNNLLMSKNDPLLKRSFNKMMVHYPSVVNSWNHMVPPMPNYCGIKEGHLTLHQVEALQAHHETAFIDEGMRNRATARYDPENEIPDAPGIVEQVVNTLIPAVLEWFFSFFTERAGNRISDEMSHKIMADTPRDTVKLLEPPLAMNISNLGVEALTASLTQSVSHAIVSELGPYTATMVAQSLQTSIYSEIKPFLENTIPQKVNEFTPDLVSRSLPVFISEQLTKSLTHSLVPSLTQALSVTSDQHIWCQLCAQKGQHCNYCHSSPQGMYYAIYYSTYYSDWYSDYYAKYYVDALKKIDEKVHIAGAQTDARLRNVGKTMDYDLVEDA